MDLHERVQAMVAELHPEWTEPYRKSFIRIMYSITGRDNERGIANFIRSYERA